jgi:hypothetical protein
MKSGAIVVKTYPNFPTVITRTKVGAENSIKLINNPTTGTNAKYLILVLKYFPLIKEITENRITANLKSTSDISSSLKHPAVSTPENPHPKLNRK